MSSGMITHMVLRQLAQQPLSGYRLVQKIGEATGRKPSYGSIYPILERLAKEKLVTMREQGRSKVYALTPQGKRRAQQSLHECASFFDEEKVRIKQLMELMDMDPQPMLAILERARSGEPPLGKISANMFVFRDLMFRKVEDGSADRHEKEINAMLRSMIAKVEKMK